MFAARAASQQRGFRIDEATAPAVARLCRRLDGLPLALELAATRVRALGVQGVVDRLDDRFALLTTRQRDMPPRQTQDYTAARGLAERAYKLAVEQGAPTAVIFAEKMSSPRDGIGALEGMASAATDPAIAARLLGAASAARITLEAPAAPAERDEVDRVTERLTTALGRDRFDVLRTEGMELGPAEARAQV